jgi:hypothetical protein
VVLALAGHREEAKSILRGLVELSKKTYVSDVQRACVLHCLGERDRAFEHLEQAYERRAIDLPDIRMMQHMKELRADPRWISLERRMGF